MNIIGIAKITSVGQITIPKPVRERLMLKEGDRIIFLEDKDDAQKMQMIFRRYEGEKV